MIRHEHDNDFVVTPCKVGDVCDEGIFNDLLIKKLDASILHSFQHWAQNPQSELTDSTFLAKSLLSFELGAVAASYSNQKSSNQGNLSTENYGRTASLQMP